MDNMAIDTVSIAYLKQILKETFYISFAVSLFLVNYYLISTKVFLFMFWAFMTLSVFWSRTSSCSRDSNKWEPCICNKRNPMRKMLEQYAQVKKNFSYISYHYRNSQDSHNENSLRFGRTKTQLHGAMTNLLTHVLLPSSLTVALRECGSQ